MNSNRTYEQLLKGLPVDKLDEVIERTADKETLVLHHMRDAFFYAMCVSGGKMEDDEVYDLCYAALVSAAKNYDSAKGRFMAYAKVYIRGQISQKWQVLKQPGTISLDADFGNDDPDVCPRHTSLVDPEFGMIDIKERMALVQPMLNQLSEQERTIVDLHFRAGYNFRHIGKLLGVTRSAVQQTASRALRKLQMRIREKDSLCAVRHS